MRFLDDSQCTAHVSSRCVDPGRGDFHSRSVSDARVLGTTLVTPHLSNVPRTRRGVLPGDEVWPARPSRAVSIGDLVLEEPPTRATMFRSSGQAEQRLCRSFHHTLLLSFIVKTPVQVFRVSVKHIIIQKPMLGLAITAVP